MELTLMLSSLITMLSVLPYLTHGYLENVQERGLRWCDNFCLCTHTSEESIQCMQPDDIYAILNFNEVQIMRLNRVGWDPISNLKWCSSGRCFCNRETNKAFACVEVPDYLTRFINTTADKIVPEEDEQVAVAGFGDYEESSDSTHRKRDMDEDRRNRRRNRKNRRNKKRNRHDHINNELDELNYDEGSSQELLPNYDDVEQSAENQMDYRDPNLLPKQEAINSNPMVTAMQPPTRKQPTPPPTPPTYFTNSSHPRVQGVSNSEYKPEASGRINSRPEYEVPVQRKTVAGKVSEDLKQITDDVQHIRSDVIFNQRILLVTVGIAGVAMLGVVILALHACCSRSSRRRSNPSENGGKDKHHHGHHPSSTVSKFNTDEAW